MKKEYRNSLLLVLTALIWGIAFVAQREGGDAVGPYTFNCIRSLIGAVVLLPVIKLLGRRAAKQDTQTAADSKQLWLGGISCGVILFVASTFQQLGMYYGTTAGKAGFLTACYILIVPLLGLFLKKKCGWNIWVSVFVAVIGLYFLCLKDGFTVQLSDGLVLLCAFVFSIHILVIDYFSPRVDGVRMSCIQFLVCGILGIFPSICIDMQHSMVQAELVLSALGTWDAWIPILYAGIFSCGVAYTLQIVGQDGVNPTVASLLLSLESVFSVLAGMVILHETMSSREILGCVLVFAAVLFAQLRLDNRNINS
ncbi:MAG: DMT family transporter [Lachnospiraceae bacterium]|nr:DMT family transporter [Lachnospiraceae bacterium]